MTSQTISEALSHIIQDNTIFYSEDDLKFKLAWQLKIMFPSLKMILEKPIEIDMYTREGNKYSVSAPIDIIMELDGNTYPIEIKYKTTKGRDQADEVLKKQNGYPEGRFRFRRDIYRIEYLKEKLPNVKKGFCIFVTNDNKYTEIVKDGNFDQNYSLGNGQIVPQIDPGWQYTNNVTDEYYDKGAWVNLGAAKRHWTCRVKDNFTKLDLKASYKIKWQKKGLFHYLILQIN